MIQRPASLVVGCLRLVSVIALFPWVLLHELAHYLAAFPWSGDATLSVYPPRVSISFTNPNRLIDLWVGLAPTVVGYAVAFVTIVGLGWYPVVTNPVDLYLVLGWIVFATPSPRDVTAFYRE
ncbi:hypothetical protein AB7C87_17035 [Natrarchaeobius sp. A-rgal3]|uniref:hypothetical protein n=1 Tax=Natrarchaeobius versutus TaxID=1679078 RepID=UPI0035100EC4